MNERLSINKITEMRYLLSLLNDFKGNSVAVVRSTKLTKEQKNTTLTKFLHQLEDIFDIPSECTKEQEAFKYTHSDIMNLYIEISRNICMGNQSKEMG